MYAYITVTTIHFIHSYQLNKTKTKSAKIPLWGNMNNRSDSFNWFFLWRSLLRASHVSFFFLLRCIFVHIAWVEWNWIWRIHLKSSMWAELIVYYGKYIDHFNMSNKGQICKPNWRKYCIFCYTFDLLQFFFPNLFTVFFLVKSKLQFPNYNKSLKLYRPYNTKTLSLLTKFKSITRFETKKSFNLGTLFLFFTWPVNMERAKHTQHTHTLTQFMGSNPFVVFSVCLPRYVESN